MKRICTVLLGALFLSGAVTALAANGRAPSPTDPPIISWQAPATFTPAHAAGRTALTDIAGPLPLVPMVPCRQYDSRSATPLADNTPRTVVLTGAPCGVLTNSFAVAVNITVFSITGAGSNGVFKVGTAAPPTTAWINYPPSETQRGNAGVLATNGTSIVVQINQGAGSVDFTIDIFGYYPQNDSGHLLNAGEYFEIATSIAPPFASINARNNSTAAGALALQGIAGGASGNTIAVFGTNASSGSGSLGVSGLATNGIGVKGTSTANVGVQGLSTSFNGLWGQSTTQDGLFASGGREGAFIQGARNGAIIVTSSTAGDTSGVYGQDGVGAAGILTTGWFSAGVRGFGKNGVIGITSTGGGDGVVGAAIAPATTAIIAFGNFSATGTKAFIEPHPTDAAKEIRFVAMEGPEAGTYFRAKATVLNGLAVIDVPDSFRMVTDQEGLTVHVTPVGRAQTWIESYDLNRIVVGASKDVPVSVIVYGVRHAFTDWQVVAENQSFRPVSPDQTIPQWLTKDAKARLIANGTYNADGTVNMRTAEQVGWAQQWRDEAAAQAKAAQESSMKAASLPQDR